MDPPPCDRLYTQDEIDRLCAALGIDVEHAKQLDSVSQRVGVASLFAIETAKRAGAICGLMPADSSGRVAVLQHTKNSTK